MARILVVDDESTIRDVVSRWLIAAGHEPAEADCAHAALNVMATEPAAVVLCDVQMPGHDGLWLTGELRRRFPTTAVVLATGVSSVPPQISMQFGVLAYLLKPFDRKALLAAVEQGVAWHSDAGSTSARSEETADGLMALAGTDRRHDAGGAGR